MAHEKRDLYQEVTDKILSQLETGTKEGKPLWVGSLASMGLSRNAKTRKPYRGVNLLLTSCSTFSSPLWITFQQAREAGGHVNKGEKGTPIVHFSMVEKDSEEGKKPGFVPILRHFTVFNVEQCSGLPESLTVFEPACQVKGSNPAEWQTNLESFFECLKADIRHGGSRAFFSPAHDYIQLPNREAFRDCWSYHATLAHEVTHWTGHKDRLAREFGKRFGDHAYAFEELVAELGSAFLCARLGLELEPREDHASYLSSWLQVLKQDKKAIFTAASSAQRACDYILQLAGWKEEGEE